MKLTLLEIVQDLLGSIEDDEVNSINDVESSTRVAKIVRECYNEIVGAANLPEHWQFYELDTESDVTTPTLMNLPDNTGSLDSLQYNCSEDGGVEFRYMKFLPIDKFVELMYNLDTDADNVEHFTKTINGNTIDFLVLNDKMPEYYTTWDDYYIILDSYDSDVDTFLTKAKTMAYGQVLPEFSLTDTYVPDLDPKQFALLINESKRQVFNEFRQSDNPLAAQRARRGWIRLQRDKWTAPSPTLSYDALPDYGRKTR